MAGYQSPASTRRTRGKSAEHEFEELKRVIHGKLVDKLDLSRLGDLEGDTLRREIYTDSTVTLTGESRQIRAGGLRADWGGRLLQLSDDVVARYEPKN